MAYCATSDVKDYIDFDSDSAADDGLIADLVIRAQKTIDTYCHRTFGSTGGASDLTPATRYFHAVEDVDGATLWLDADIPAIDSDLTVTNGDAVAVANSDLSPKPSNERPIYALVLKASSGIAWTYDTDPEDAISIAGYWCYAGTTPADITHACVRLTCWLYKQRESGAELDRPLLLGDGNVIMPTQLPRDVTQILEPYRKRRVG